MTTTDAAAARRQSFAVALAAVIGLAGFGLAGCGGSLFGSADNTVQEPPPPKAVAQAPIAKVAISSIVGPPDLLGKQLHQEFASALERQRVVVASRKDERADFSLRPYILASKEKNGTKVSYVLDVSEPSGKRVNRFAGEEVVPGSPSQDPWSAITPTIAQAVATKVTGAFVAWLPNAKGPMVADTTPPPSGVGKSDAKPLRVVARKKAVSSSETTGSIAKDENLTAFVAGVTGAPGDGNASLTAAVQRELQIKGVALADRSSTGTYRVEGAVTLGETREGKQPIQIEWVVKDQHGKKKGTVSQKNDIPEGLLDKEWGPTADQAAKAAVQGILKLLPASEKG